MFAGRVLRISGFRRVVTSKITATASTAPRTMYWYEMSVPIRFMPLVSDMYTSAPMIEPVTLPTPPAAETPPMYAAAMRRARTACRPWRGRLQARGEQDARQRREHAHGAEDDVDDPLDADAAQLGRLGVAAHRIDVPAQHGGVVMKW